RSIVLALSEALDGETAPGQRRTLHTLQVGHLSLGPKLFKIAKGDVQASLRVVQRAMGRAGINAKMRGQCGQAMIGNIGIDVAAEQTGAENRQSRQDELRLLKLPSQKSHI